MMELGEGLCKLRKMNFESGPFLQFEQEISAVLEFIYQTQLELAACEFLLWGIWSWLLFIFHCLTSISLYLHWVPGISPLQNTYTTFLHWTGNLKCKILTHSLIKFSWGCSNRYWWFLHSNGSIREIIPTSWRLWRRTASVPLGGRPKWNCVHCVLPWEVSRHWWDTKKGKTSNP